MVSERRVPRLQEFDSLLIILIKRPTVFHLQKLGNEEHGRKGHQDCCFDMCERNQRAGTILLFWFRLEPRTGTGGYSLLCKTTIEIERKKNLLEKYNWKNVDYGGAQPKSRNKRRKLQTAMNTET